ncbi:MAG: ketopantoate reductase PanE/ApbA C terminal-domain-containing protein [Lentinula lateritia]|uniref:Ketopantoate reductase PanE/ApbA C terminal-domain-containing protein n=1 Tax=Lentinula lateritia TaxID=40482 RepID=A0ABQ8W150_9AGAR|nr:MAG: ketopantoate reductase PanE/ApbA C terminal-domain-containing protein [Lentinula lateritia]KAJ4501747.1 ketopantoate reductase PanE/ApbA C terminal-domain-containing protein [Lentinula lateritia]
MTQEILVVGFGAVGAIYAYSLHRTDKVRLTVVARGNYELIKEHGMYIKSQRFGNVEAWKPYRVVNSISSAADRQYSHVILSTKCVPEVIKTPDLLKPLISSPYCDQFQQPVYVLLQNGLNIEVDLYRAIKALGKPEEPVIINTGVYVFANLISANVVEHGPFARLDIGVYRPHDYTTMVNSPAEQQVLEGLKELFHNVDINIYPEIQRKKFAKNMLNIAYAACACLTRCSLTSLFRPPPTNVPYEPYLDPVTADRVNLYTRKWIKDILDECVRLGRAMGFPDSEDGLPSSIVENSMKTSEKNYSGPDSNHNPSTLLDIEKGAPIEVEVIWGETVRLAKERDVEVPRIEMAYAMLLLVQNQILRQINSSKQT